MPQLQVLEQSPGFSQQLGQALGSGVGQGLSQGISGRLQEHLQARKNRSALEGLSPMFKELGFDEGQLKTLVNSGISPEIMISAMKANASIQKAKAGAEDQKKIAQDAFNRQSELLKKGNIGLGSKYKAVLLGGEAAEDVGEFESLGGSMESMLKDKVSKGVLSQARFKYIIETLLPKANDRDRTIRGKLKALAQQLDLDPSALTGDDPSEQKGRGEEKASSDFVTIEDPSGVIKKIPKDRAKAAISAGGKLIQ